MGQTCSENLCFNDVTIQKSENASCSVVSDSLPLYGLYSSQNSLGQNTGVGSLSLLQGIFPIQGLNPGLPHCRWILYQLSHKGTPRYWSGQPIPSPADLPNPGIKPGSPALQADALPAKLPGKPGLYSGSLLIILYIVVCVCSCEIPSIAFPPPCPFGNHKFVFYVCECLFLFCKQFICVNFLKFHI